MDTFIYKGGPESMQQLRPASVKSPVIMTLPLIAYDKTYFLQQSDATNIDFV